MFLVSQNSRVMACDGDEVGEENVNSNENVAIAMRFERSSALSQARTVGNYRADLSHD